MREARPGSGDDGDGPADGGGSGRGDAPDLVLRALGLALAALLVERFVARPGVMAPALGALMGPGVVSELPLAAEGAFVTSLLILGVASVAGGFVALGRTPVELGIRAGRWETGLVVVTAGLPVAVLAGWVGARSGALAGAYPVGEPLGPAAAVFVPYALAYLAYYVGFELFFRGYLLLGLEDVLGAGPANLLQAGLATAAHLGMPWLEVGAAFPASLVFGWVALRTRSIVYPVLLHWAVGASLDWFLVAGG